MPSPLTLFEHEFIPYKNLGINPDNPLLDAIDHLNENAGVNYFDWNGKD